MKVTYTGRHRAVEVDAAGVIVANGETIDVPDEIAESLLRQTGQWEKAAATAKKSPTPTKNEEAD